MVIARSARVLVVDDNVDAAQTLALLLRLWGYETRVAHDGCEALQAAPGFQPDLVFLDIGLPGMDGYEVAQKLRCRPGTKKACLVAITGYGQEQDYRRSQEAGMDYHLVKPVDAEALQEVLAHWEVLAH